MPEGDTAQAATGTEAGTEAATEEQSEKEAHTELREFSVVYNDRALNAMSAGRSGWAGA